MTGEYCLLFWGDYCIICWQKVTFAKDPLVGADAKNLDCGQKVTGKRSKKIHPRSLKKDWISDEYDIILI